MTRRLGPFLLLGLVGWLAVTSSLASDSRDAALQTRGWMTADDATIRQFPTDLLDYPNRVFGELGAELGGHEYAGGHLSLGPSVLRILVGEFPDVGAGGTLIEQARTATYRVGNVLPQEVENAGLAEGKVPSGRIHALFARPIGTKGRGAIGFDYSAETWADLLAPGPAEGSPGAGSRLLNQASLWNGYVGWSLPLAPFDQLAFSVRAGRPTFEGRREQAMTGVNPYIEKASYQDDGGRALGACVRGTRRDLVGRNSESLLYLRFESGALDGISRHNSATDPSTRVDSRKELRLTTVSVGLANNHLFSSRLRAIWGTQFDWTRSEINVDDEAVDAETRTESDQTAISWPAVVAVEGWLRPWWAARFSASSNLWSRIESTARFEDLRAPLRSIPKSHSRASGSRREVAIGTTLRFAGFSIDGVVNRSLLYDGPYFLGGSSTGILTRISLGYEF